MKLLSTIAIAALLGAGSAFAATTPTATAGAMATPAAAPAATTAKKEGGHCYKQAQEKKLTGDAEKTFVKECKAAAKKAN
jgi:hypothetical protein